MKDLTRLFGNLLRSISRSKIVKIASYIAATNINNYTILKIFEILKISNESNKGSNDGYTWKTMINIEYIMHSTDTLMNQETQRLFIKNKE